ncbi:MAG: HAMP domain-containing histidine kinase [Eubacterium sp.]|nr:HAMP domain-containing histidine kinase [Eubacterium sp.]
MNKKLCFIASFFALVIMIAMVVIINKIGEYESRLAVSDREVAVNVNEIKQSIEDGDTEKAALVCDELVRNNSGEYKDIYLKYVVIIPFVICIAAIIVLVIYLDITVLKPFRELKDYANEISKGNLDKTIEVKRGNYFGDFTWAFGNMRREIIKSRSAEKNAIENNKTVIATLSHDIKTPVASIRAYAEAFEANMDSNAEKRQKYLSTIMEKCDEVTKLTNDLFIHSISEMDRLEIKEESIELKAFIDTEVRKLFVDDEVEILLPEEEVIIKADPKRLVQIFENLKNNSAKYAKTAVQIKLENSDQVVVHFRDYGQGIPEEEIPFITGKFYRGKNVGEESGSGLGLYIVKELMEKMGGALRLLNRDPGLDVILEFNS